MVKQTNPNHAEILIAEDSPTQLEQLRHALEGNGYAVRSATNGKKALDEARRHPPSVIISDIVMPEMNGYELCRAIRKDESLKDTPVVLLTSLSGPSDVIEALKVGADNFIRKPYDERHLLLRVENILTNRKLRATDTVKVGVELQLGGGKHFITAERQQILDLLISTYEQAVQLCGELKLREDQLDRANKVLSGIYTITKGLNHAQTEREVLDTAMELALQLPDVRAGWIFLKDDESHFRLATSRNLPSELATPEIMDGDCLCRRQVLSGEIGRSANIAECERLKKAKENTLGLKSHVTLPFRFGDKVLGIMNLVGTQDVLFTDNDLRVLNGIGNQIGVALQRCRLHEHLEELVQERTASLMTEIDERKQTEAALVESEKKYRTLAESLGEVIYLSDPETFVVKQVNRAVSILYGHEVKDWLTDPTLWERTIYEEDRQRVISEFAHAREQLANGVIEYRIVRKDKSIRWVEDHMNWLVDADGNLVSLNGIVYDVTERKQMQEERKILEAQLIQAQKMETIGALAGGIAHDFNNLLGIIMGHAGLLEGIKGGPPEIPPSVEAITRAVDRGAGLVRQLMTFARKTDTEIQSVAMNTIIEELVKMLKPSFPKTISLRTALDQNLPTLNADPNQINQALLNLAVNARDAMPDGGTLEFKTSVRHGRELKQRFADVQDIVYVCVNVSDNGIGIGEDIQSRIFEPFFTTKGIGKGTGLGMSVVYGVLKSHQGFIDLESAIGRGTMFSLYLPVHEDRLAVRDRDDHLSKEPAGGTETVLVVEDEALLRELVVVILTAMGYHVLIAADGAEAVTVYQTHKEEIDLVLTDVGLPLLDGLAVVTSVKDIDPEAKIILATGYLEPDKKSAMLKAGVKGIIQKPYKAAEVLSKVRSVLDEK